MKIAIGISGGIAAYKAAEIVRLLQEREVRAQVIMTQAAQQFVRPLTFAALTGEKVITGIFSGENANADTIKAEGADGTAANLESAIEHIAVAQEIGCLLVVPATANIIARFAHGIADDFLTTLYLATKAPVIIAPAMNVNMWEHVATRENLATLRRRGARIVEPDEGYLACGMTGPGRLASNEAIVAAVMASLGLQPRVQAGQDLAGETILITAGPTREPIDPVRFIGNRSSGKMGYAMAEAAWRRGARVILVSGPTALAPPLGTDTYPVETAEQMRNAVLEHLSAATIVIKTAAVSDYRPVSQAVRKIKRQDNQRMTLELEPTADILAEAAAEAAGSAKIIVGFAAETDRVPENARRKLAAKAVDAIVVNDVSQPGIGFDSERNAVTIITAKEAISVPEAPKLEIAHRVLDVVVSLRRTHKRIS